MRNFLILLKLAHLYNLLVLRVLCIPFNWQAFCKRRYWKEKQFKKMGGVKLYTRVTRDVIRVGIQIAIAGVIILYFGIKACFSPDYGLGQDIEIFKFVFVGLFSVGFGLFLVYGFLNMEKPYRKKSMKRSSRRYIGRVGRKKRKIR